jgi:hypothetical protein
MPLGPRNATCVQPAPKSRFVVSGLLRSKIKIKIHRNGNGNATVNAGLLTKCHCLFPSVTAFNPALQPALATG